MPQEHSNSVLSEIDEIIARAMAEYAESRGMDLSDFDDTTTDVSAEVTESAPEPIPEETVPDQIPENSPSILVEETTSRFSDAIWYNNVMSKHVVLAGLGGIGSYVAFLLGRLHVAILDMYDDDRVEEANMSGQLYNRNDCGIAKTAAMQYMLSNYASYYNAYSREMRFTDETPPRNIMICGFDSMESRRVFYHSWKGLVASLPENEKKTCLFIDGRLAAENFQVLCITGDDTASMVRYESDFLFSDDEADETICSYKQTTFMANMIGSIIVNLFVNFCANECDPLIPRDLPFLTEYSADTMYFKTVA